MATNQPDDPPLRSLSPDFIPELTKLLHQHEVDDYCGVPDYLLASLLAAVLRAQRVLNWNHHLNHASPGPPSDFIGWDRSK